MTKRSTRPLDKVAQTIHSLIKDCTGEKENPLERRWCPVTAVDLTAFPVTCTITLSGTSVPGIICLGDYVPQVNDQALVLQEGTDLVCIGTNNIGGGWQTPGLTNSWVANAD